MIKDIVQIIILILLLYGCYTDLKFRHVSNKISFSIAALALLLFNPEILAIKGVFIIFMISSWFVHMIGSGDVKVLAPLTLMFNQWQFFIFLFIFCISGSLIGLVIHNKQYLIPGFIPITIALIFSLL
ncbi:MAG: hypothetical protein C3F06_02410 [Candidatus Methanoperedenaceae archaeon]|nr:MAG: hypothetical protein C3F06_02410 [Candidatus Methanoperedenaceae archaeon]